MDDAFWLRYLRAHADPKTRTLHAAGTILATLVGAAGIARCSPKLIGTALVCGYGPAWYTHAFIEHNKPETFSAPLRSLAADYRMLWNGLTGALGGELGRASSTIASPEKAARA